MQSNLWPAFQCCTWHSFLQYHAPKHRMHRFNGEDPASFVQFVQWLFASFSTIDMNLITKSFVSTVGSPFSALRAQSRDFGMGLCPGISMILSNRSKPRRYNANDKLNADTGLQGSPSSIFEIHFRIMLSKDQRFGQVTFGSHEKMPQHTASSGIAMTCC